MNNIISKYEIRNSKEIRMIKVQKTRFKSVINMIFGHSLGFRYSIFVFIAVLIFFTSCFADGQAGLDIAVLKAGVGARALGMGK
jgi:hypothetical protein